MTKSVICVICAVVFLLIITIIACLKPSVNYARNDEDNYCVYFQKWISTVVFMCTIIMALFCIYFAVNQMNHIIAYLLLVLECMLLVIYSLTKYKAITVNEENIRVERLFRKDIETKFKNISRAYYVPNAKLSIKLKRLQNFDVSFNSENFHKFFNSLIKYNVKFKTSKVPSDLNHVVLNKFGITIKFPKTMFREYYQSKAYFRNSQYLFSARSLEHQEYIEGYIKESGKELLEFIEIIKTDLALNEFKYVSDKKEILDGFDFTVIKAISKIDDQKARYAFVYKEKDNYLVLYCDYLLKDELDFYAKIKSAIRAVKYEDGRNSLTRV